MSFRIFMNTNLTNSRCRQPVNENGQFMALTHLKTSMPETDDRSYGKLIYLRKHFTANATAVYVFANNFIFR